MGTSDDKSNLKIELELKIYETHKEFLRHRSESRDRYELGERWIHLQKGYTMLYKEPFIYQDSDGFKSSNKQR